MRTCGFCIPARKIEHTVMRPRFSIAPWVHALLIVRSPEGGALKFRFGRQARVAPPCERACLGMTHIRRPCRRKRDPVEHAEPLPFPVPAFPESVRGCLCLLQP